MVSVIIHIQERTFLFVSLSCLRANMNESTIYGITILDDYSPTYGLLDASFWALGIGYDVGNSASPSAGYGFNTSNLTLSWYGCLNDNGVHDCAEMCTDPNNIWASANNSMYTLANCAVYPFISVLLSNNGLDVTSQAVAKDFNILPMNATGDVITPIAGCINSTAGSSCTGIAIYDPNAIYLPGWSLSVQAMVSWQVRIMYPPSFTPTSKKLIFWCDSTTRQIASRTHGRFVTYKTMATI